MKNLNLSSKLSVNEMQEIQAGKMSIGCGLAIVGGVSAFIGLVTLTAGTALPVALATAAGWIVTPAGIALSCS